MRLFDNLEVKETITNLSNINNITKYLYNRMVLTLEMEESSYK